MLHHGEIGTTAQTLYAGRAMLVVPFTFDRPDNAFRMHRLGVALITHRQRCSAGRAGEELKILLKNPQYSKTAEELGRAVRSENGQESARNAIDEVMCKRYRRICVVLTPDCGKFSILGKATAGLISVKNWPVCKSRSTYDLDVLSFRAAVFFRYEERYG